MKDAGAQDAQVKEVEKEEIVLRNLRKTAQIRKYKRRKSEEAKRAKEMEGNESTFKNYASSRTRISLLYQLLELIY